MITLATLEQATAQEVFDQVAAHLLTQGKQSRARNVDKGTYCAYRGDQGLKCAAGCLIGDDEYYVSMEGVGWDIFVKEGRVTKKHYDLIRSLQLMHDTQPSSIWEDCLKKMAHDYNLDDKIVTTTQTQLNK